MKGRLGRQGGDFSILVEKSFQFSHLTVSSSTTVEAVNVSVFFSANALIDFASVYVSNGAVSDSAALSSIFKRRNSYVIVGDFNGHHVSW